MTSKKKNTPKAPAAKKKPGTRGASPRAGVAPAAKKAAAKKAKAPKKMGRPTLFTDKLAALICQRLADGESLRSICASDSMPHRNTVMVWLGEREHFQGQYARAREMQADLYAAEVVEIADRTLPAVKRTIKGKGKTRTVEEQHGDAVERSRLMMDARKWYASKLAPKKYGEKLAVSGDDDGAPLTVLVKHYGQKQEAAGA